MTQQAAVQHDPFQLFSLTPFEFDYLVDDYSSSEAVTGTVSPASSMHSCHDDGLVSSCDPAASEFLLFALALHDQGIAGQQHHNKESQQQPAARSFAASKTPSQMGSSNGLCTLTRTCAGVLDAMLPSDCAHTARDAHGQNDASRHSKQKQHPKQQALSQEEQDDSVQMH